MGSGLFPGETVALAPSDLNPRYALQGFAAAFARIRVRKSDIIVAESCNMLQANV